MEVRDDNGFQVITLTIASAFFEKTSSALMAQLI